MKITELKEAGGQDLWGVHYSGKANLKVLRANQWNNGDGLPGAERSRFQSHPESFIKKRIFFYIWNSNYQKESGLGPYEYKVKLVNLYDWDQDPRDFFSQAGKLAHNQYVSEYKALMKKTMDIDDPEIDPSHYDFGLAQNIMEQLIKKAGYNGYFSRNSNDVIVYFYDVRTGEQLYGKVAVA
jgi:hypothetical protein